MSKNILAIFFSMVLAFLVIAPTIIVAIDNSEDISYFYSITEEEENNTCKKLSELNVLSSENSIDFESLFFSKTGNSLQYTFKTYPKPHLNLTSPPPELF